MTINRGADNSTFVPDLLWHSGRKSWFTNYSPEKIWRLSKSDKRAFADEPLARLFEVVVDAAAIFSTQRESVSTQGLCFHSKPFTRGEIEQAVDCCSRLIWAYVKDLEDEEPLSSHSARDGMDDAFILHSVLTDFADERLSSESESSETAGDFDDETWLIEKLPSGRLLDESHFFAALAMWKIDHAIGAVKLNDLSASVRLALDASSAAHFARERLAAHENADIALHGKRKEASERARFLATKRHAGSAATRLLAVERYRSKKWDNPKKAAAEIYPSLCVDAKKMFGFSFSERGQQTVYEWLLKDRKNTSAR